MSAHTASAHTVAAAPPPFQQVEVGRVLSVGASNALVQISPALIRANKLRLVEIGTVLKIITSTSVVVCMVSSLRIGAQDGEGMADGCIATLNILGEITTSAATRETKFHRGVRSYPVLSEPVYNMSSAELDVIFSTGDAAVIDVGRLQQDDSIHAEIQTDELLSKHFAIIGSTGSGKSCTVALVIREILKTNPDGHVVLFDPHNEYSHSFGHMAEVIRHDTLNLPLWLFDFEETVELLASEIEEQKREEKEVLADLVLKAKVMYDRSLRKDDISAQASLDDIDAELLKTGSHITVDSPSPYRIRDLMRLVQHYMGKLENASRIAPYQRLKRRIDSLINDPRYSFAFRNQTAPRPIEEIIGTIFRLPVQGKPIAILDMSGIPSETINVVVSVISRLAFEIAMWSDRKVPILLVCEEAHRYIPSAHHLGFHSTRKAISRIAKEGRKYGVSLAIISQRPSELEPSTLSQCSTIFSMRLSNEVDQQFVKAAVPDGAADLLSFLPSLGVAEAMVFGEAVNMPMRVMLSMLEAEYRPHSSSAKFTDVWARGELTPNFTAQIFNNWRSRQLGAETVAYSGEQGAQPSQARPGGRNAYGHAHAPQRQPGRAAQSARAAFAAAQQQASQAPHQPTQTLADVKSALNTAYHAGGRARR